MVQAALHPRMLEFLDLATGSGESALGMAEIVLGERPSWVGRTLAVLDVGRRFGVTVVGVSASDGHVDPKPSEDRTLGAGEALLVFGPRDALERIAVEAGS